MKKNAYEKKPGSMRLRVGSPAYAAIKAAVIGLPDYSW